MNYEKSPDSKRITKILPKWPEAEWHFEDLEMEATGHWKMEACSLEGGLSLQSAISMWCCFSHIQDSWVWESRGGDQRVSFHFYSLLATTKFLLPVPATLGFAGLDVLAPMSGIWSPGEIALVTEHWKLSLPPGHSGFLILVYQQEKKRLTIQTGELILIIKWKLVWDEGMRRGLAGM